MNYEEFVAALMEELKRYMENGDVYVNTSKTVKGNDTTLDSFQIGFEGSRLEPNMYFNQMYALYEHGYSVAQIADEVFRQARKAVLEMEHVPELSRETAEENLYCTVMNVESNREYLKSTPYEQFGDMAVVPRFRVHEPYGSILITKTMCSLDFKMTPEEVMELARRNTESMRFELESIV